MIRSQFRKKEPMPKLVRIYLGMSEYITNIVTSVYFLSNCKVLRNLDVSKDRVQII